MDVERTVREFFARDPRGAVAVYLFGSVARGTARPDSDVDVGVLFERAPEPGFEGLPLDLEADLERALGLPVQVVALDHAPADLVHRVLRDGKVLLDRDRSRRIAFEVRKRNEFFDMQPVWREYRKARGAPPSGGERA